MTAPSGGVTRGLLERLLEDQRRRAKREQKLPYAEKLRVLDRLMANREAVATDAPGRRTED